MADLRSKAVLAALIDRISARYPLSSIFTDLGPAMKLGDSIDIPTFTDALTVQDASSSGASVALTIETASATANNLVIDKHKAVFLDIPKFQRMFDLEGAWASQIANTILTKLWNYVDADLYDDLVLNAGFSTSGAYWVNAEADALGTADINLAMAKMLAQDGVRKEDLVWVFNPYGSGSLANISAWQPQPSFLGGDKLGHPTIGFLNGVPVVESQKVRSQITAACTAVSISSNVATVTVPSGHGFVPGMKITISGITTPLTVAAAISAVTATTLTVPLTASDGAMADGAGTVTCNISCNGLVHRPWAFRAMSQMPEIRIVPREARDSDVLQATMLWGKKSLAGAFIGLGSPREAVV